VGEQLPAPLSVVCRVAGVSRSAACVTRRRRGASEPLRRRPGPVGVMSDRELLTEIRDVLATSPFVAEGHRKVWARLRRRGVRTSRKRVLRLTREAGLLAPTARVRKRAQRLTAPRPKHEHTSPRSLTRSWHDRFVHQSVR
jgi:putative transposase